LPLNRLVGGGSAGHARARPEGVFPRTNDFYVPGFEFDGLFVARQQEAKSFKTRARIPKEAAPPNAKPSMATGSFAGMPVLVEEAVLSLRELGNVQGWLEGRSPPAASPPPPPEPGTAPPTGIGAFSTKRRHSCFSMPGTKLEYPWYAAWTWLSIDCIPLQRWLTRFRQKTAYFPVAYANGTCITPNGQLPAYNDGRF